MPKPHTHYVSNVLEMMPIGCTLSVPQVRTIAKSLAGYPDWREANGTGPISARLELEIKVAPVDRRFRLNYSPRGALLGVTRER